ncbi:LytR/AlgR family response regulator transcription factor [Paenibacillus xylanilyticus]|uniref:LytR/AlgR family response regulator transcription factor n=1 Tax=Paenibacillus xylanilyticus TaxID=248903 RepID=UPI0039A3BB7D
MLKKNLTAIIAEDNINDREKMEKYAKGLGITILCSVASGEWLIDECVFYKPDVVFLKNDLNGTPGLTAFEKLMDYGITMPYLIIFADKLNAELMLAGLQLDCLYFLNKPLKLNQMSKAIHKVRIAMERDLRIANGSPGRIIHLRSNYKTFYVNELNLIYAHKLKGAHRTIVFIDGNENEITTSSSLKEILSQCSNSLIMPNQSNIINMKYVKQVYASEMSLGNYIIQLHNNIEIDLPRRNRRMFEEAFANYNR